VLLDAEGSGNLMYLPLDKLLEQTKEGAGRQVTGGGNARSTGSAGSEGAQRQAEDSRIRRGR
jgi:hypothetical protein